MLIIKYKIIGLGNCYLSSYKEISYACFLFQSLKHFVTWKSVKYSRPVTNRKEKETTYALALLVGSFTPPMWGISWYFLLNNLSVFPYHFVHPWLSHAKYLILFGLIWTKHLILMSRNVHFVMNQIFPHGCTF